MGGKYFTQCQRVYICGRTNDSAEHISSLLKCLGCFLLFPSGFSGYHCDAGECFLEPLAVISQRKTNGETLGWPSLCPAQGSDRSGSLPSWSCRHQTQPGVFHLVSWLMMWTRQTSPPVLLAYPRLSHLYLWLFIPDNWASLVAQLVRNPPALRETWVRSLGREDPLEEEMATQPSILVWRTPWTEEPGRLQSTGPQWVGHDWVTKHSTAYQTIISHCLLPGNVP